MRQLWGSAVTEAAKFRRFGRNGDTAGLPLARRVAQRIGDGVFHVGVLITLVLSYWVAASGIVAHVFE